MEYSHKFGLSGSTLKLIAIITMLIDHTGATVVRALSRSGYIFSDPKTIKWITELYQPMRNIGRIAFPIFCFLLVEGFVHTRNVKKYAGRLFLFALISEMPFDFALKNSWFFPDKQNVYFTLLIGLFVLWGITVCQGLGILQLLIMGVGMLTAYYLKTDYGYRGVFLIEVLYLFRFSRIYQCLGGAAAISWELPAPIAFLPVLFYNGKRGLSLKYFFYWFYPVHLMILGLITKVIFPRIA